MNISAHPARPVAALLLLAALLAAPSHLLAQQRAASDPEATPEDIGAHEGVVDGRRSGLETGQDRGRAQVLADAWLRGFRQGLTQDGTWRRDASWAVGLSEGHRPGRAAGLEAGHARGRMACAEAFLRLLGRPAFLSEAAPEPPAPPPPPLYSACEPPRVLRLQFTHRIAHDIDPADCEQRESPLGMEIPKPDMPENSALRQRAYDDGFEGDAIEAWIRGYKTLFRQEFTSAFRTQRDMVPGHVIRQWETDGYTEGRREGERRNACDNFARGYDLGWREGFDEGWDRGFAEAWEDEERIHLENPVVRILDARLTDESADGIIEPGEGVRAEIDLANAGMVATRGEALAWEGVTSLANRGAVAGMSAQSRHAETLDLGRIPEQALFGAGVVVNLRAQNGDTRVLESRVGRPVVLEGASARLDVADGKLIARVSASIANVATRDADRELSAWAGDDHAELGPMRAGERRQAELIVPASSSWLADASTGSVELRSGSATWMRRDWTHAPRFGDSLQVAARLPPGSPELDDALATLSRRLMAELARAMNDPKLYNRLDDGSDLAELARVRATLPATTRADVEARLARPLSQHAETKGTPRKVRRAIRQALGRPVD